MQERKGSMMKHMGMHGMMKSAMPQSMATTSDGNIVVLAGNKLLKYDQDLNLVKQQTIQTDFSGMQTMMQQMKEQCPMCREMMNE